MSSASSSAAPQPESKPSGAPKPMDFSGTDPSLTDGVVFVEGQKFHVSKTHLARHSMFFETMFFEKGFQEANQKIVELKEVSAEGFQIFLELINGYNRLSDNNIEAAIQCSSMWQSEVPMRKCTKFLQKKSKFSITEKFLLADKLDLIDLKKSNFNFIRFGVSSAEGFQIFLELINGYNRLSDNNIEAAIQCSSMWQSEVPMRKCTKFLQKKSKFSITEKFLLADKLDLIDLKKSMIKEVKTNADLEQLVGSHDVSVFKPATVELIARKSLDINRVNRPPVVDLTWMAG